MSVFATFGNTVYKFDGTSWSLLYTAPNPTGSEWSNCYVFADDDLWVSFATASTSYIYHYTGSWTAYSIPGTRIRSFWGMSSNDLWAFGNEAGAKVWHFNGTSWSNTYNPGTDQSYSHRFLCGSATNKIWMGRTNNYFNGWHNWEHGWNGSSWTEYIDTPGGAFSTPSVRFNPYDNKFYAWVSTGGRQYIFTHTNEIDSSGWTQIHDVTTPSNDYNNNLHVYQDKIWGAIGNGAPAPVWYYNGSSWASVGPSGVDWIGCMAGSGETIWIGGRGPGFYAYVYKRSPAGVWTNYDLGVYNQSVQGIGLTPPQVFIRSTDETVTLDELAQTNHRSRSAYEVVDLAESVLRVASYSRTSQEAVTQSDTSFRSSSQTRVVEDVALLTDILHRAAASNRSIEESVILYETTTEEDFIWRNETDAVDLTETHLIKHIQGRVRPSHETLNVVETTTIEVWTRLSASAVYDAQSGLLFITAGIAGRSAYVVPPPECKVTFDLGDGYPITVDYHQAKRDGHWEIRCRRSSLVDSIVVTISGGNRSSSVLVNTAVTPLGGGGYPQAKNLGM